MARFGGLFCTTYPPAKLQQRSASATIHARHYFALSALRHFTLLQGVFVCSDSAIAGYSPSPLHLAVALAPGRLP
tara:strand:- start:4030 stop:4254 length:225 start_codon:yes stop_codon:yes gene_type:complete